MFFKCVAAFLLLLTPAFALDRVVVRDARGKIIGGIVYKGGKSVYVDRKGHVAAISVQRGGRMVVKTFPNRGTR